MYQYNNEKFATFITHSPMLDASSWPPVTTWVLLTISLSPARFASTRVEALHAE
jgi:hypothetical protein